MNILSFFKRRSDDRCEFSPPAAFAETLSSDLVEWRGIRAEPNAWKRGHMTRALKAKIAKREAGQLAQGRK